MQNIQTTGGLFTEESRKTVVSNICRVFDCEEKDIEELIPVQAGLTNVVLSFNLNGGKYVYRHPGLGSEILVERGRETIMQKIVEDAGIDTTLIAMDVDEGWLLCDYMYAEVKNNTDELAYNIEVVFALTDKNGKLLYVDSQDIYECALTPGSSMVFRCEIPSSFMDYFESKGLEPAKVDAIAYRLNYR